MKEDVTFFVFPKKTAPEREKRKRGGKSGKVMQHIHFLICDVIYTYLERELRRMAAEAKLVECGNIHEMLLNVNMQLGRQLT